MSTASSKLAERYMLILEGRHPDPHALSPDLCHTHLRWMCATIVSNAYCWPVDKISRWLGFIQGVMASQSLISVSVERDFSRELFHEEYVENGVSPPLTVYRCVVES